MARMACVTLKHRWHAWHMDGMDGMDGGHGTHGMHGIHGMHGMPVIRQTVEHANCAALQQAE